MDARPRTLALVSFSISYPRPAAQTPARGTPGVPVPPLPLQQAVDAFPATDSAGLYIAQMQGLFAAQGPHVTIVPVQGPPPSTQDLVNGQEQGKYDITAGDYVTYIEDQQGVMNAPKGSPVSASFAPEPMTRFGLLPGGSNFQIASMISG